MITLQPGEQEIDVIKTASLELHLTTQRIFQVSNLGALKTVQIIPLRSVNSFGFITKHFEKLLLFAGVSLLAMFVLLLYPESLYYPVYISEEDAIKYAFFLLLIAIGLTIAWWETRTVGIGICSQSGKTLLFFPTVGKTAPMRIQFLGKLQFALKKGNMQLFDEATMQRYATVTSSSPFEMLPAELKKPAMFGSVVLLVIVVGLFLFKAVPPLLYEMEAYLAEMKAEKIASTVNAVKTAEPEQIDVPQLSKQVFKGQFEDNPYIQSYTGIYSATSEEGDMTTQTSLEIKLLENDKAEMVLKTLSGGWDGDGNQVESVEKIEPPKQAEIVGNALILETGKGRFTTLTIRDYWGTVRNTYGLIFNGTFYERTGDLIGSSSNVRTAPTPKPKTTAPQPPTRVEEKKTTPSVPNEPPAASSGDNSTMGIITGEGVRMRSSMDKTSKANIIDKFAKGTKVEILERNGEWVKARVKGKVGYIASQYVE